MNSKISIIVPIYNVEKYLKRCIDSILNQTYKDIEIILVSDGPGNEHLMCDEYAKIDTRIKVIKDINKGLGGARNAGMKIATGEYIAFVDSDDWIEPETYEIALNKMIETSADFVCWIANIVPETGFDNENFLDGMKEYHKVKIVGLKEYTEDILCNTTVTVWNKLYKKSIIQKNNILFPENMMYEDNEFFFKYSLYVKKAYYLDKYFYNYYQRTNSLMQSMNVGNRQTIDCIKVYRNVYEYYKKNNALSSHKKLLCNFFKDILYKFPKAKDKKYVKKELLKLVKKIDNDILQDEMIELVQKNKLYKIHNLDVPKYEFGNKFLGVRYANGKAKLALFGISISFKTKKQDRSVRND